MCRVSVELRGAETVRSAVSITASRASIVEIPSDDKRSASKVTSWKQRYGNPAELLLAFWGSIGFIPGPYMTVGMNQKRAAWLNRVLERLRSMQ
jgi:hypothetical protein